MAGLGGFDDGPDLAIGTVKGFRQWKFGADGSLTGANNMTWADGENIATCQRADPRPHPVPWSFTDRRKEALRERSIYLTMELELARGDKAAEVGARLAEVNDLLASGQDCGCGFWAYWELNPDEVNMGERPVAGVIEGYGRTIIGKRGFRCEKARIVAIHCGWEYVLPAEPQVSQEAPRYTKDTPEAIARIAADEALLGERYPSARIYASLKAMLAAHPVSKPTATGSADERN